jgi:hypothetical protein
MAERSNKKKVGAVIFVHGKQKAKYLAALLTGRLRAKRLIAGPLLEKLRNLSIRGQVKTPQRRKFLEDEAATLAVIECIGVVAIPLEVHPCEFDSYQTPKLICALAKAQKTELLGTNFEKNNEPLVQFDVHKKLKNWYADLRVQNIVERLRGKEYYYLVGLEPFSLLSAFYGFKTADLTVFSGDAKEGESILIAAKRELQEEAALTDSELGALCWDDDCVEVDKTCIYNVHLKEGPTTCTWLCLIFVLFFFLCYWTL